MAGLDSPLSLVAGAQVQLGTAASATAGLGAGAGFTASAGVRATASVRGALGGIADEATAGFVLAANGGVAASASALATVDVAAAQGSARAAFVVPPLSAGATVTAVVSAAPDPRSLGYGRGIPLRARVVVRSAVR
jgi:hypothetical protein